MIAHSPRTEPAQQAQAPVLGSGFGLPRWRAADILGSRACPLLPRITVLGRRFSTLSSSRRRADQPCLALVSYARSSLWMSSRKSGSPGVLTSVRGPHCVFIRFNKLVAGCRTYPMNLQRRTLGQRRFPPEGGQGQGSGEEGGRPEYPEPCGDTDAQE